MLWEEVEGELRWQMVPLQEIQEALVDQVVEQEELVVLEQEQQIKEIMEVLVLKVPKCLVEEVVVLEL